LAAAIVTALGIAGCSKKAAPAAPVAGTPAASSTTAAAPTAAVDTDADLLTKAKTAENEKRLYAPAGDNAIEYYLALRQRNPKDESAKSALLDLFPYAMIATEQNLKKGDEPGRIEAARIFALLERVDTNAPSLPRLRAMMQKEAGDELKQQQDAAKKAQEDLAKKTEADKAAAALKAQQQAAAQNPATPPQPVERPAQKEPPPRPAQTQASAPAPAPAPAPTEAAPTPKPAHSGLPDVVSSVQPVYPRDALRDGVSGEVTVAFTVNPDGSVSGASVVTSNPRRVFDAAALDAIRKWKFEAPGEAVNGKRTFAFNPGN
jgi:protein TonB